MRRVLSVIATMAFVELTAAQSYITPINVPSSGSSSITAMSRDGSTLIGFVEDGFNDRFFRWTPTGGVDWLAGHGLENARFYGVSPNGDHLVGEAVINGTPTQAVIWDESNGLRPLGWTGYATGVDSTGTIVVGNVGGTAIRWTASGGVLPLGNSASTAFGWNDDLSVVVGLSSATPLGGFRWSSGTLESLVPPQGLTRTLPSAATNSGGLAFGYGDNNAASYLLRWDGDGAVESLGSIPGRFITDVISTGDGSLVAFNTYRSIGPFGGSFVWKESTGFQRLSDLLTARGVDLTGWSDLAIYQIGSDGTSFAGNGSFNGEYRLWYASVPSPSTLPMALLGIVVVARRRRAAFGPGSRISLSPV